MVVMVTPPAFTSIGYNTYTVFACINAFMVPCVYFFYPETAGRSLEEMDDIFQDVSGFKGAFDVVKVSLTKPRRFGKHGEMLINYEDTERHQSIVAGRRGSSVAAGTPGMPQPPKMEGDAPEHYEEKSDSSH